MRINNLSLSPKFSALWQSDENFSPIQTAIILDIKDKVRCKYESGFNDKTPIKWLEDNGYDIFIRKPDENSNDVQMLLIDRVEDEYNPDFNYRATVGKYNQKIRFDVQDLIDARKDELMSFAAMMLIPILVIFSILANFTKQKIYDENIIKVESYEKDSIKNFINEVKKDTISFNKKLRK